MPELPEVETTLRGVAPYLIGETITEIDIRERRLRWPVPLEVDNLAGAQIVGASRRAKYLLFDTGRGTLILHLGMSGSLRVIDPEAEWRKHDHIALRLSSGKELRFHDPRRFGCLLFCEGDPAAHRLIRNLGPEPLDDAFDGSILAAKAAGRSSAIKQFIMDAHVVVGVGNIYACEALFMAGIHPKRAAGKISKPRLVKLVSAIKEVLGHSIEMGGTTLRDFLREDGQPGYFKQSLRVYGRENDSCLICESTIRRIVQNGRSTFFCGVCQR
ncbi:MAG: bifunctional DNA-formamidopyrimidine glycosylase/DNA-(apurinic or apyrimidinic site) lyase [Verrucomicrobiae bacterium]|nr:bifunctional DNA-formamidopyrimidine glycosylase/DNA-(apurinic or apyrimidinic site) lyase [Verrucomicrobiae bacterium]